MSGGAFDYLFVKMEDDPIGTQTLDLLLEAADVAERLGSEAAPEIRDLYNQLNALREKAVQIANKPARELLRAFEYNISGDCSAELLRVKLEIYKESKVQNG